MTAFLPDADIQESFTRELSAAIERSPPKTPIDAEALATAITQGFEAAVAANRDAVIDGPSEQHLQRCAAMLAGYRALSTQIDDEVWTLAVLRDALLTPRMATVREWLGERMGVDPEWPEGAYAATQANFKARGGRVFGKAYTYEQEVKDENRNTEGDPMVKGRLRQKMKELTLGRLIAEVPKADLVLVNPVHVAVALRYRPGYAAPRVVAKGLRKRALRIKQLARDAGVPVVEDPPLARALYRETKAGGFIPTEFFATVAVILARLQREGRRRFTT